MAGAYVQGVNQLTDNDGGSASPTQQFTNPTGAGNMLFSVFHVYPSTAPPLNNIQDSQGNTWVVAFSGVITASPYREYVAYALNTAGGTAVIVTYNFTGATIIFSAALLEYSGVDTLRGTNFVSDSGPGNLTGASTTTVVGDLVIGTLQAEDGGALTSAGTTQSYTVRNYFGELISRIYGQVEDAITTSTTTFADWGPSAADAYEAGILVFYKSTPVGGGGSGLWLAMDASVRNSGLRH